MISELVKRCFNTFFMVLLLLILSGCATSTPNPNSTPVPRRIFKDLRVYSATPGTPRQFYDPIADKILSEDVWVFRSDGTYKAAVNVDGEILDLSGVYAGDDTGQGFIFRLKRTTIALLTSRFIRMIIFHLSNGDVKVNR